MNSFISCLWEHQQPVCHTHPLCLCYNPVYWGECSTVWLFSAPLRANLENRLREFGRFRRPLSSTMLHISLFKKYHIMTPKDSSGWNTVKWWASETAIHHEHTLVIFISWSQFVIVSWTRWYEISAINAAPQAWDLQILWKFKQIFNYFSSDNATDNESCELFIIFIY
jgi:hypothetical protein